MLQRKLLAIETDDVLHCFMIWDPLVGPLWAAVGLSCVKCSMKKK